MSFREPITLDLPSEPGILSVVRETLRALARCQPNVRLDEIAVGEMQVALQEACTNAIRHAHDRDPTRRIQVVFHRAPDGLLIEVSDGGEPYELSEHVPDPEDLAEGGYGTSIMRAWMDEVRLERRDGRNVLTLFRRYDRETVVSGDVAL